MKTIGKFVPKQNNEWNEEFIVTTKEACPENKYGEAYEGLKVNGSPYHVYSAYWEFIPNK